MFPTNSCLNILLGICVSICIVSVLCIEEIDIQEKNMHVFEKPIADEKIIDIFKTKRAAPKENNPNANKPQVKFACEKSNLQVTCPKGQVIQLIQASYGRKILSKCNPNNNKKFNVKCKSDKAKMIMREKCHQKNSCTVKASNSVFGDPCRGTIKYLEMKYKCVAGKGITKIWNTKRTTPKRITPKKEATTKVLPTKGTTQQIKIPKNEGTTIISKTETPIRKDSTSKDTTLETTPLETTTKDKETTIILKTEIPTQKDITSKDTSLETTPLETTTKDADKPFSMYACEGQELNVKCEEGKVIQLLQANYGRTSVTKCDNNHNTQPIVKCINPKTEDIVKSICNGKHSCNVAATNSLFGDPCDGIIKYLEVQYLCVPDATTLANTTPGNPTLTTAPTTKETTKQQTTDQQTTDQVTTRQQTTDQQTTDQETTRQQTTDQQTTDQETTAPIPTTTQTPVIPTSKPRVTAPDTDCDTDDLDCIIDDLGDKPNWFVCESDMGSYPHPTTRKLFIFCMNWKPRVKKCGRDLVFSEDLMTCVSA